MTFDKNMLPTFLTEVHIRFGDFTPDQLPSFTVDPQNILFIVKRLILSKKYTFYKLVVPVYFTHSPNIFVKTSISTFWEINALLKTICDT